MIVTKGYGSNLIITQGYGSIGVAVEEAVEILRIAWTAMSFNKTAKDFEIGSNILNE